MKKLPKCEVCGDVVSELYLKRDNGVFTSGHKGCLRNPHALKKIRKLEDENKRLRDMVIQNVVLNPSAGSHKKALEYLEGLGIIDSDGELK